MNRTPALSVSVGLILGSVAGLMSPGSLAAQTRTLSWTETTRIEVPGTLGTLLRALPGGLDTQSSHQTLHLQGGALVQDDGRSATIFDAGARRFITIDHDAGTYTTMTFDESAQAAREMSALMAEAMAGADVGLDEARAERDAALKELRQAMEEARAELHFRISSENTGRTQRFGAAGTAAQHFVLAELEGTAAPDGVEDVEGGTMVFLVELWQSRELPGADAFYQQWATGLAGDPAMQSLAHDLAVPAQAASDAGAAALAVWDPRISAGLAEVADAVDRIEGTTVRSIVTIALVPMGAALDREALLAWQPESMGAQLRQAAGGAVRDAAADAARGAIRGLSGRLGARGGRDEPGAAADGGPPATRPLLRVTTTKEDIVHGESNQDVLGPLMQRIEGYRQITLEDLLRDAQQR
jgi:hypothetical protein